MMPLCPGVQGSAAPYIQRLIGPVTRQIRRRLCGPGMTVFTRADITNGSVRRRAVWPCGAETRPTVGLIGTPLGFADQQVPIPLQFRPVAARLDTMWINAAWRPRREQVAAAAATAVPCLFAIPPVPCVFVSKRERRYPVRSGDGGRGGGAPGQEVADETFAV